MAQHPRDVDYEGYGGLGFDRDRSGLEFPLTKDTLFRDAESGELVPYSKILDEIHELREATARRRAGLAPEAGGLAVNEGPAVTEMAAQNGMENGQVAAANGHGVLAETAPFDAQSVAHANGAHTNGNSTHLNGDGVQPNLTENGSVSNEIILTPAFMPPIARSD